MLSLTFVLGFGGAAQASTIYTYTGSPFNFFQGPVPAGVTHISGTVTFAAPLPGNMPFTQLGTSPVTPLSINFTDGINTYTSPDINNDFYLGTDASGAINRWEISLGHILGGQSMLIIYEPPSFLIGDDSVNESAPSVVVWEAGTRTPGTWTGGGGGTSVPEPSSLLLLSTGLIGLVSTMRKNRFVRH